MKRTLLALAIITAAPSAVLAQDSIPVVSASVMQVAAREARALSVGAEGSPVAATAPSMTGAAISEETVLTMTPGVNQIIPVAVGHPNRIVTPFGTPEVISTSLTGTSGQDGSCGEVCIKDNVVYVATDKEHPVTMFITEKGSEAQALSITMVPRRIPPREVFLKLSGQTLAAGAYTSPKAERWEQSQPYIDTIRDVFRKLALGEIPQGYTLTETPNNIAPPVCQQPGLNVGFAGGQMLMGHNLSVFVGVANNVSGDALEFLGAACGDWDVAAATSWPLNVLEPGQSTEIYVARKQQRGVSETSKRPSLLGGAR